MSGIITSREALRRACVCLCVNDDVAAGFHSSSTFVCGAGVGVVDVDVGVVVVGWVHSSSSSSIDTSSGGNIRTLYTVYIHISVLSIHIFSP